MSSTAISTAGKMRALAAEPANRPAMSLLLRSTIAMVVMPIAVYYLCFELLLAKGGIWDLSEDLNWRVNISGFASIAAVQVRTLLRHGDLPRGVRVMERAARSLRVTLPRGKLHRIQPATPGLEAQRAEPAVPGVNNSQHLDTSRPWRAQVVIATHVVAAFRSDEQQFAQEKAAKAKYS